MDNNDSSSTRSKATLELHKSNNNDPISGQQTLTDTSMAGASDETNESDTDNDEDPLEVRNVALVFDYLMYKIKDHVAEITDSVIQNVDYARNQQELEISRVNRHIKKARQLITKCDRTDMEIEKLVQLQSITKDFCDRLMNVDRHMNEHNKKYGH